MVTLGEQHENDPAPPEPFRLGYQRWLDGLRGLAILLVLALHLHLLPGGHLGVDIFFVLSGFLITTQLTEQWQQHGSINLSGFYYRRARRLLPAFFALLLLCVLLDVGAPAREPRSGIREVLVAACCLSNWPALHHTRMPRLGHTWSLCLGACPRIHPHPCDTSTDLFVEAIVGLDLHLGAHRSP